jgi:hypothetical protein
MLVNVRSEALMPEQSLRLTTSSGHQILSLDHAMMIGFPLAAQPPSRDDPISSVNEVISPRSAR